MARIVNGMRHVDYGVCRVESCGWITSKTKILPGKPLDKCEACGRETEIVDYMDVASLSATIADNWSKRITEHAAKHNLFVYQLSKNRWVVLREAGSSSIRYNDGVGHAYRRMEAVCGPADWQKVMKYIRENTPELPTYLIRSIEK